MTRSICRKQTELTSRRCLWAEKRACAGPDGQFVRCSSMTRFFVVICYLIFLRESNCRLSFFVICLLNIVMKCDNILFSTVFWIRFHWRCIDFYADTFWIGWYSNWDWWRFLLLGRNSICKDNQWISNKFEIRVSRKIISMWFFQDELPGHPSSGHF